MKRLVVFVVVSLVAMLLLAPIAFAQEEQVSGEVEPPGGGEVEIQAQGPPEVVEPAVQQVEQKAAAQPGIEGTVAIEATQPKMEGTQPLPKSGGSGIGGPALILPAAAALLLGSGILTYAGLRHRRS